MGKPLIFQKCVIYARVSSKEQEREGYSIPAQLKFLNEYAVKNNFIVAKEFVDNETAKKAGRTNFNEMIKFLRKNKRIKTILVEKTDRLYRNFKDYVLLDEFEGIEIHLVKENTILSDNSKSHEKFIHGIKVLMAKNYIDNLSEEVKKGMLQKATQGEYPGKPPYGYKRKKGEKEIYVVSDEAQFVRRAFELYSNGFKSLDNVIEELYSEGYRYRQNHPKIRKSMLSKMLMNIFYTGDFMFSGVFYKGKHSAIISKEMYNKVQKAFKKDNKPDTILKHHFLFSGLMTCPKCGSAIVGQIKKGKYIYYSCSDKTKNCPNRKIYVRQEKIEKVFEAAIKNVEISTEQKEAMIIALKESYRDESAFYAEEIERLRKQSDILQSRIDKLYTDKLDGIITEEFWAEKHNEWNNELSILLRKMEMNRNANKDYMDLGIKLLELVENLYSRYISLSQEEKEKTLKIIFQNFYLDGENAGYTYKKPFNSIAEGVICSKWWAVLDSNQRPPQCRCDALPTAPTALNNIIIY